MVCSSNTNTGATVGQAPQRPVPNTRSRHNEQNTASEHHRTTDRSMCSVRSTTHTACARHALQGRGCCVLCPRWAALRVARLSPAVRGFLWNRQRTVSMSIPATAATRGGARRKNANTAIDPDRGRKWRSIGTRRSGYKGEVPAPRRDCCWTNTPSSASSPPPSGPARGLPICLRRTHLPRHRPPRHPLP